jgi:hypothetical protein
MLVTTRIAEVAPVTVEEAAAGAEEEKPAED